jgi:hypothetical protein
LVRRARGVRMMMERARTAQQQRVAAARAASRKLSGEAHCKRGWTALGNVTLGAAGSAVTAGAAGAIEAAVAALKRRPAEALVLFGACHALRSLTSNSADRAAEAGAAGAVKAVVAALRAFPDDVDVQRTGCAALNGILKTAGSRRRAFQCGAGEAIIGAIDAHTRRR